MGQVTLPPDYFRTAAELYTKNPTDRMAWLKDQIAKADSSLIQYQAELNEIGLLLVKKNAAPSDAAKLTIIGGVVSALPTPYTKVVGGLLMIGGTFFAKSENKAKSKEIADLITIGKSRTQEAEQVAQYKRKYEQELLIWKWLPLALVVVIIWLIIF